MRYLSTNKDKHPSDNATSNANSRTKERKTVLTDLPKINGYDSLMVIVDHGLTKGVILHACAKTIDALLDTVYKQFGLPNSIISDRGPQFVAMVFTELGKLLGIMLKKSTAYHPQTDGGTGQPRNGSILPNLLLQQPGNLEAKPGNNGICAQSTTSFFYEKNTVLPNDGI